MSTLDDTNESLRDTLVAAFRADTPDRDDTLAEPAPAKEPVTREPVAREQRETAKPTEKVPDEKAPASDDKTAARAPQKDAKDKTADADKPLEPPVRWTKTQKERFYSWPREVQQQVLEENRGYQQDYTRKSMDLAQERKRFEGIEKVLAPRRQTFNGLDDAAALEQVMQYWDHAGRDPLGFIQSFAQSRGIDLAAKFGPTQEQLDAYFAQYYSQVGQNGAAPNPNATVSPAVQQRLDMLERQNQQLLQQMGQTQQYLGSREQQEQQRTWNSVADELRQFEHATDANGQPAHPFFNEVREDMSRLIAQGFSSDLKDAYDKATRLRSDIFSKIQESQEVSRIKQAEQRRAAEAAAARKAGASVASSSVDYKGPPAGGEALSLREELERNFRAALGGNRV